MVRQNLIKKQKAEVLKLVKKHLLKFSLAYFYKYFAKKVLVRMKSILFTAAMKAYK